MTRDLGGSAEGLVHPDFRSVADAVPRALRTARGGAFAVYHRGELVVDTWTGVRDQTTSDPWAAATTAVSWSATKGVTSAALLLFVQRGALRLDDRVADHWPEFAAAGKDEVLVRHVLAQEAGLHDVRHLVTDAEELLHHEHMAARLAGATPAYPPGTANGYHALTYGYLVEEIVRRVSGRSLADVVRVELAEPLGLEGFSIGADPQMQGTMAPPPPQQAVGAGVRRAAKAMNLVTRLPPARVDLRSVAAAFVPPGGEIIGCPEFVASGNASIGGVFTARALARFYAALLEPLDGTDLWSDATRALAGESRNHRRDLVLSIRPHWRLGYHRPWPRKQLGPRAFGFSGMYGSGGWADPDRRLAVALVCPDARNLPLHRLGRLAIDVADRRT